MVRSAFVHVLKIVCLLQAERIVTDNAMLLNRVTELEGSEDRCDGMCDGVCQKHEDRKETTTMPELAFQLAGEKSAETV